VFEGWRSKFEPDSNICFTTISSEIYVQFSSSGVQDVTN
jgi:hypothetical protein